MIESGAVLVSGSRAEKAARLVAAGEALEVTSAAPRFVSRGGDKLEAAIDRFGVDPAGARALDVGSSTGGFTHCLLEHGALSVTAVDVGRNQMHERLRADPRIRLFEKTHILDAGPELLGPDLFDVVVADLSFISLTRVAARLVELARPDADIVVLVKPQFEAGRQEASRGKGVIRDPAVWRRVLEEVIDAFEGLGAAMMGAMPSPLRGADGNVEFLVRLRAPDTFRCRPDDPAGGAGRPVPRSRAEVLDEVVDSATRDSSVGGPVT